MRLVSTIHKARITKCTFITVEGELESIFPTTSITTRHRVEQWVIDTVSAVDRHLPDLSKRTTQFASQAVELTCVARGLRYRLVHSYMLFDVSKDFES